MGKACYIKFVKFTNNSVFWLAKMMFCVFLNVISNAPTGWQCEFSPRDPVSAARWRYPPASVSACGRSHLSPVPHLASASPATRKHSNIVRLYGIELQTANTQTLYGCMVLNCNQQTLKHCTAVWYWMANRSVWVLVLIIIITPQKIPYPYLIFLLT